MKNDDYSNFIDKIIKSKSFGHSKTYANLLRYLFKCTLDEEVPKEITIATEIFGKNDFDPSNSTLIRVYVYNLRKKLSRYYNREGKEDEVVIKIPRGGYRVLFEQRTKENETKYRFSKRWLVLSILFLLGVTMYCIIRFQNNMANNDVSHNILWKDFFENNKPAMIVLGDLFIYSESNTETGRVVNVRDPGVNSLEEYKKMESDSAYSNSNVAPLKYTYLIRSSANWVDDLSKLFYSTKKDYSIRAMSRFDPKELSENDLIVVGMIKTLGVFRDYFKNSSYVFESRNSSDSVYSENILANHFSYQPSGDPDAYHTDYAVMVKIPGPNNNLIYLFGGIWDTGASQSLKNFTDPKLIHELEQKIKEKLGAIPKYFEVFFEVKGIDRLELSSKILSINQIDPETDIWDID